MHTKKIVRKQVIAPPMLGFKRLTDISDKYVHVCTQCKREIPPGKQGRKCKDCRTINEMRIS